MPDRDEHAEQAGEAAEAIAKAAEEATKVDGEATKEAEEATKVAVETAETEEGTTIALEAAAPEEAAADWEAPPEAGRLVRLAIARPCSVLGAVLATCALCIALAFVLPGSGLDWSDPRLGFEPRGTELSLKLNAYQQLYVYPSHRPCGSCDTATEVVAEAEALMWDHWDAARGDADWNETVSSVDACCRDGPVPAVTFPGPVIEDKGHCANPYPDRSDPSFARVMSSLSECYGGGRDNFFCQTLQQKVYRFALTLGHPKESGDLASVESLRAMCELSLKARTSNAYRTHGRLDWGGAACPILSLPELLLMLDVLRRADLQGALTPELEREFVDITMGAVRCDSLGQGVLDELLAPSGLLRKCGLALWSGTCHRGEEGSGGSLLCDGENVTGDSTLQSTCTQEVNMLVNFIFQHVADREWMSPESPGVYSRHLRYANLFLQFDGDVKPNKPYNKVVEEFSDYMGSGDGDVTIKGISARSKSSIFNQQTWKDVAWVALGAAVSFACLVSHLQSLTISVVLILQVTVSFWTAFFLHTVVLGFKYFPFMNMLLLFIALAIGVDDVFVFMDAYKQSFRSLPPDCCFSSRLQWTCNRAFGAMLVTTLTTAVAFLGNTISSITLIRSFGLFGAQVIVVDFVLMVVVLPCILVFAECNERYGRCTNSCTFSWNSSIVAKSGRGEKPRERLLERLYRDHFAPLVAHKVLRWIVFAMFTGLGALNLVVAMGLEQSESQELQLFVDWHPTEKYDQDLYRHFRFEDLAGSRLQVSFVAGVEPSDTGSHWDPNDFGGIEFSEGSLDSQDAQVYFRDLCRSLPGAPLYKSTTTCFYQELELFATSELCTQGSGCCGGQFPIPQESMPECLQALFANRSWPLVPDVWFPSPGIMVGRDYRVKAVMLRYRTTKRFVATLSYLQSFHDEVASWSEAWCAAAPPGVAKPFWMSNLAWWDFQTSMNTGAFQSIVVASVSCAGVLLLVAGNVMMALFAVTSIVWILASTMATLIFMGWKMDVIVAIVLSISVGMSVDFVCHVAHAYVHDPNVETPGDCSISHLFASQLPCRSSEHRARRTTRALHAMGISITMGALTTFGGGAAMLPAQIKLVFQFGQFLCVAMVWASLYAVLHFSSTAALFGPVWHFGDISAACLRARAASKRQ